METNSPIKIDKQDGTVFVDGTLDRERTPVVKIKVIARDGGIFDADQVRFI